MKKIFKSNDSGSLNQANKSRKLSHERSSSDVQALTSTQLQSPSLEFSMTPSSASVPATSGKEVPVANTAIAVPRRSTRNASLVDASNLTKQAFSVDATNSTDQDTWQYRDNAENNIMSDVTIPDAVDTTSTSSADKPVPAKASTSAIRTPKASTSTSAPIPDAQPSSSAAPQSEIEPTIPSQSQSQSLTRPQPGIEVQPQTQSQPLVPAQQTRPHIHQPTGYTWTRDEDAPGYSWRTKKAQEEMGRAMEQIVDREKTVGRRYGDIGLDA